jgi:hypothetical protein
MRTLSTRGKLAVLSTVIALWGTFTYACSVEDENPATEPRSKVDSGGEGSVNPNNVDAQANPKICGKYGGFEKVKTIAAAIVARVAQDCRINVPFANLNPARTQHLAECFEKQLGGFFGCDGVIYESGKTLDHPGGQACRSMTQAHQGMNLRKADFDAFRGDVEAELTAQGLTPDDVRSIAAAFEGTRASVVQTNNQPAANTFCDCAAGANPTCTKPIVDAGTDVNDAASDVTDGGDSG